MKTKRLVLYIIDTNDSILPERRAEAIDFVNAQSDEIATLRAQLAEARDIVIILAYLDEILTPNDTNEFVSVNILISNIKKARAWYEKVKSA